MYIIIYQIYIYIYVLSPRCRMFNSIWYVPSSQREVDVHCARMLELIRWIMRLWWETGRREPLTGSQHVMRSNMNACYGYPWIPWMHVRTGCVRFVQRFYVFYWCIRLYKYLDRSMYINSCRFSRRDFEMPRTLWICANLPRTSFLNFIQF